MNPAPPVTNSFTAPRSSGPHRPVGPTAARDVRSLRVRAIARRQHGVLDAPIGADHVVVPGHAELVGLVVVPVDQVRDRHGGQRGEPVGHARRDVHAQVVLARQVEGERVTVGGAALAQVVQHHAGRAERHVPVVRLVEVVVQADDGTGLAVGPVALQHLAALREPRAPVGLDETAPLVAVDIRRDDEDAGDLLGRFDLGHAYSTSTRQWSPTMTRRARGRVWVRTISTSLPIRLSSMRGMSMMRLRSRMTECSTSELSTSQCAPMAENGPTKLLTMRVPAPMATGPRMWDEMTSAPSATVTRPSRVDTSSTLPSTLVSIFSSSRRLASSSGVNFPVSIHQPDSSSMRTRWPW